MVSLCSLIVFQSVKLSACPHHLCSGNGYSTSHRHQLLCPVWKQRNIREFKTTCYGLTTAKLYYYQTWHKALAGQYTCLKAACNTDSHRRETRSLVLHAHPTFKLSTHQLLLVLHSKYIFVTEFL